MRKKSASKDEVKDSEALTSDAPIPRQDDHGKRRSFSSAKYDPARKSDTLDRRKGERSACQVTHGANLSAETEISSLGSRKTTVLAPDATGTDNKDMDMTRCWRRDRRRSAWWCSLLIILTTIVSAALLFITLKSFTSRQNDPKGCDMYYSRPIFINFADFDTEHTRFASKYSLHLYREYGYDQDAKVESASPL